MSSSERYSPVPLPPNPNLEQQKKLAKDLLEAYRSDDPQAKQRVADHLPKHDPARSIALHDTQFVIAREYGFESWPKFAAHIREVNQANAIDRFKKAVLDGEHRRVKSLINEYPSLREKIHAPLFDFDRPAIVAARDNIKLVDVLLESGANIDARSDWHAGGFGVLDNASDEVARELTARGATVDVHAAAWLGDMDRLRELIEADSSLVHAEGGDGQRPLHFARKIEIAGYLLDHGAEIDALCVDHKSTAAHYRCGDSPDVVKFLIERGAKPDILIAAAINDIDLVNRLLDEDPDCISTRVGREGSPLITDSPGGHIYQWVLGFDLTPHDVARKFGHQEVYELLLERSPIEERLLAACSNGDRDTAIALLDENDTLVDSLSLDRMSVFANAASRGDQEAVRLMLDVGFDLRARGQDQGTVLHLAAWNGDIVLVDLLLQHDPPLNDTNDIHGSPPLCWCAFGSHIRRHPDGDYLAVAERLIDAGADIHMPGNKKGSTMLQMAEGNPEMQELLRRHGAR